MAQSVVSDFGSSHDLTVCGFKPCVGLCADSSETGACFRLCLHLSLCSSPAHALSFCLSKINVKKKTQSENINNDIQCKKRRVMKLRNL